MISRGSWGRVLTAILFTHHTRWSKLGFRHQEAAQEDAQAQAQEDAEEDTLPASLSVLVRLRRLSTPWPSGN
jgi:hypothetical protein